MSTNRNARRDKYKKFGQTEEPRQELRVHYYNSKVPMQIANVCSWLGINPMEYVKNLILEDLKAQPDHYRLQFKPEL